MQWVAKSQSQHHTTNAGSGNAGSALYEGNEKTTMAEINGPCTLGSNERLIAAFADSLIAEARATRCFTVQPATSLTTQRSFGGAGNTLCSPDLSKTN